MAAVILLAAAAGVAVALYLSATRGSGGGQNNLPIAQVPVESEPASPAEGGVDQTARQLEALAARMEELEAENRRLQQEEAASGSPSDAGNNDDGEGGDGAAPAAETLLAAVNARKGGWEPRDWSVPAREEQAELAPRAQTAAGDTDTAGDGRSGSSDPVFVPAADATGGGAATRTPREPSFAERDRRRVQDALTQWSNGQQTEALEALDEFTVEHPQAHLSREMLGKLLLQRGETGIAMQVADIGLRIAPMHNGYRKLKARLLMAANRPGEAVQLLDDRPPSTEGDTEYHELLATAALASQQYPVAQRSYERLLGADDTEGRWWYGVATALEGQGQAGNATRAYQRAQRSATLSSRLRQRSEERIAQLTAR